MSQPRRGYGLALTGNLIRCQLRTADTIVPCIRTIGAGIGTVVGNVQRGKKKNSTAEVASRQLRSLLGHGLKMNIGSIAEQQNKIFYGEALFGKNRANRSVVGMRNQRIHRN